MRSRDFGGFFGSGIVITILVLLAFIILRWLQIPSGYFADWLVGIASFWWLMLIVTVPWNIHFEAKRVLAEAANSQEANIPIKPEKVIYVQMVAQRSLWVAIALHLGSALGLYALAFYGISAIGYISSGAALLLTALRPAIRGYEYVADMLADIQQEFKYPREDVVKLLNQVTELEQQVQSLEQRLDLTQPDSWASEQVAQVTELQQNMKELRQEFKRFAAQNEADHERLPREFQQAISQIATDRELLNHIRELLRFFKQA